MDNYPEANLRHYTFMLEGLRETAQALAARGIAFVLRHGPPARVALELAERASLVVCDRATCGSRRRGGAKLRRGAMPGGAGRVGCHRARGSGFTKSGVCRAHFAAAHSAAARRAPRRVGAHDHSASRGSSISAAIPRPSRCRITRAHAQARPFRSARDALFARRHRGCRSALSRVPRDRLATYAEHRNQPQTDDVSHMSKYLHFGKSPRRGSRSKPANTASRLARTSRRSSKSCSSGASFR